MTRQEFIDNVNTWSELLEFCYDEDCDICDDIYADDAKDDYFNSILLDMARDARDWQDLLDRLTDIPTGADYYYRDDWGDWFAVDDNDTVFYDHKNDVLRWMDSGGWWDEEEEDVEEYPDTDDGEDTEDEEPVEEEDVSIAELFTICNSKFQKIGANITAAAKAAEEEDEEAFRDFCAEIGVTVTVETKGGNI